jgi:hypothetical protein
MLTARGPVTFRRMFEIIRSSQVQGRRKNCLAILLSLCFAVSFVNGCGQTARTVTSPASSLVDSYFGGPFSVAGSDLAKSNATFDHAGKQINVAAFISTQTARVPTDIIGGSFSTADTGFLNITETFATNSSGVISPQNPPLTGAWAVEIPGAGALANLLSGGGSSPHAAPAAMAENTACPSFSDLTSYLYVAVPDPAKLTSDTADYGGVTLSSQGSAITFRTQPLVIGVPRPQGFNVTAACSLTNLGALTAFPLNSSGTASNLELISIGRSGLLVSSFNRGASGTSLGAFGGGTGVLGVVQPAGPVDVNAVVSAHYNGFMYSPLNRVPANYDITVLASAFGDHSASSNACSALQTSLAANNGQGAGTVAALPSSNSLYGGEFLSTAASGAVNDPSGTNGSENCDVVIDLGIQDPTADGVFPNATVFVGSNFPPFSIANPWLCSDTGSICAVSFPAAAVVGQVQGQFVIFVAASASSIPSARLPDNFGNRQAQPVGIYLFQKTQ